jgi:DNA mismatch repair ATPase MutL
VNKRLIRDRLLLHAISEAYRNIIPPTSFPVVLLFLEMPPEEVDVNVHPAKTEVRFRQQNLIHDFVRDSLRAALVSSRPAAGFLAALENAQLASPSLMPSPASHLPRPAEDAWRRSSIPNEQLTPPTSGFPAYRASSSARSPVILPFKPHSELPGRSIRHWKTGEAAVSALQPQRRKRLSSRSCGDADGSSANRANGSNR